MMGKYTDKLIKTNCDLKLNEFDNRKSGDWNENSKPFDTNLLLNINNNNKISNTEWKCKNLYSISNLDPCNNLYSYTETTSLCKINNQSADEDDKLFKENQDNLFEKLRNYLIDYQENVLGISSSEEYTFSALMKIMGQAMAKSLLALFYFIVNVIPMTLILLFILRFILDKTLDIKKTKDRQEMAIKIMLLGLQLAFVYLSLTFIVGLIWLPILQMILRIVSCCTIDPYSN
ncbi:uncharacterized protein LOC128668764 [Microplitis demolitor]|uniref:uncharacterized protein LOC128668764 n=1 Tax=Microplitis demolitor TaxID=69319 RepID=UPI00235B6882|nr:uncharacterized protein LOC128668764 [Microplitis demolitor]